MLLFDTQERRPLFDLPHAVSRGVSAFMERSDPLSLLMGKTSGKSWKEKMPA
jgi:hypothetical protein